MRLYIDEDTASALLVKLLEQAGHDIETPATVRMLGKADALQLVHSIREVRAMLSFDYEDYENLHLLILQAKGHHPGILVLRREKDPRKNMSAREIVRALRKLEAAGAPLADQYHVLNQWK